MSPERLYAAARNGLAVLLAAEMLGTLPAQGESQIQLILPLMSAMAFGVSAVEGTPEATPQVSPPVSPQVTARPGVSASPLAGPPPAQARVPFLPSRLLIPDGYAIDLVRTPPRFVAPVDRDRVVAFDLLPQSRTSWRACIAYDQEVSRPLPGSADLLRLVVGRRF
jgi:hypothetical protein